MESPDLTRGVILYLLKLYLERPRDGEDGEDGYMLEANLLGHLSLYYRIHLDEGRLRSYMTLLKDRGYIQYRERRIGLPPHQHLELDWRITGDGLLLFTGERQDDLVRLPRFLGR
jgi:hypothetical protein